MGVKPGLPRSGENRLKVFENRALEIIFGPE
jgi:hypothetical protein